MKKALLTVVIVIAIAQFSFAKNLIVIGSKKVKFYKTGLNKSLSTSTNNKVIATLTASSITFTPTTIGWYRIASTSSFPQQGGIVQIAGVYDNRVTDVEFQYDIGGYGVGGAIQQTRYSNYNEGVVDQVRISSDGGANTYLDIHINSATSPGPVTISADGLTMPSLVTNPVVGATAGSTSISVLTLWHGFNSTGGALLAQNGGNVGIGTIDTHGYKLAVNGSAIATSMTVKLYANWPDYVFKPEYKLPTLSEVKTYIEKNQHLPDMPSEQEVKHNGINLGEMVKIQTKKIEELTLYLIEQQKINKSLQRQIDKLVNKTK